MKITIKPYETKYLREAVEIWNQVVEEGVAFPQEEYLDEISGEKFFEEQSYCGIAVGSEDKNDDEQVCGLYILHPNNVGRCGHICNASYAVKKDIRGLHIGEKLVLDCIEKGREHGFKIMQFNAVVVSNVHARHLYERLGFLELGIIPGGFRMKDGRFEDICLYYCKL